MHSGRRTLILLTLLGLGAVPALAQNSRDLERRRQYLEQARQNPELFAHLRDEYKAFLGLPPAKLEKLRKFDRELHEQGSAGSYRLIRALEKYANWLERLPEAERRRVESAADEAERLRVIKEIRQRQWVERLPKPLRDRVLAAQGEQRAALIKEIRQEEARRKEDWRQALVHWDEFMNREPPRKLSELQPGVQQFVRRQLMPRLTPEEVSRLVAAEGQWPQYLQTLVELTDKALQIPGPVGPRWIKDLPPGARQWVQTLPRNQIRELQKVEGKWPEFALRVANLAKRRNVTIAPLGVSEPSKFPAYVQSFIEYTLSRHLNENERNRLQKAVGHWPQYPKALMDLSRKHGLQFPGTALPGPPEYWAKYRKNSEPLPVDDVVP